MIERFIEWFLSHSKFEQVLIFIDIFLFFILLLALEAVFLTPTANNEVIL